MFFGLSTNIIFFNQLPSLSLFTRLPRAAEGKPPPGPAVSSICSLIVQAFWAGASLRPGLPLSLISVTVDMFEPRLRDFHLYFGIDDGPGAVAFSSPGRFRSCRTTRAINRHTIIFESERLGISIWFEPRQTL